MIKHNQVGAISGLLISLVLTALLLIGTLGFAGWAYSSRQDYKKNVDSKVESAVEVAKQAESKRKDLQFAEDAKKPLRTYNGPDAYGALAASFPKTWSGYVDDTGNSSNALVDGYFSPNIVPSLTDQNSVFALRFQLLNQSYSQTLQNLEGQQQSGKVTISAYALPKLPKVVGVKVVGELSDQKTVTMVVLPLRSQTVQVWTEGTQFGTDFEKSILPNFSFSP